MCTDERCRPTEARCTLFNESRCVVESDSFRWLSEGRLPDGGWRTEPEFRVTRLRVRGEHARG